MSKIDASENVAELISCAENGSFLVWFKGRYHGYFTTRAGAEAYLEVLEHGEGSNNSNKTATLSEVHGVL